MGKSTAKAENLVPVPQKQAESKAQQSIQTQHRSEGTNIALQEDRLHLPREPLLPKLAWISCSLCDVEVSTTMLFYFTFSWGVGCTNHTPCVPLAQAQC